MGHFRLDYSRPWFIHILSPSPFQILWPPPVHGRRVDKRNECVSHEVEFEENVLSPSVMINSLHSYPGFSASMCSSNKPGSDWSAI